MLARAPAKAEEQKSAIKDRLAQQLQLLPQETEKAVAAARSAQTFSLQENQLAYQEARAKMKHAKANDLEALTKQKAEIAIEYQKVTARMNEFVEEERQEEG